MMIRSATIICAVLFAVVLQIAAVGPAEAQIKYDKVKGLMTFGEKDIEWREFRAQYAEICGRNIIGMTDAIKTRKLTILAPEGITAQEVCSLKDEILFAMGGAQFITGKYLREEPIKNNPAIPSPILTEGYSETDSGYSLVTVFLTLRNPDPEAVAKAIGQLKGSETYSGTYHNKLILVGSKPEVRRLIGLTKALDGESTAEKIYIWTPQYSAAKEILELVEKIFKTKNGDQGGKDISNFIVDERTNQLILKGGEAACKKMLNFLPKLDVPIRSEDIIDVVNLKYQTAESLSTTLSSVAMAGKRTGKKTNQHVFGEDLDVKVTADKQTNALVLTGPKKGVEAMRKLIDEIDRFPRQVFLELQVLEMSVGDGVSAGVSVFGTKDMGDAKVLVGTSFGSTNAAAINPQALMGLAVGTQGPTNKDSGKSLGLGTDIPSFGVLLQMLQNSSKVNVLSNPFMIGIDGEDAEMIVGSNVPFVTGQAMDSNNQPILSIQRQDVALTVKIKPEVNHEGRVKLKMEIQSENLDSISETMGPTTSKKAIKTTAIAKNGERVAMGGLQSVTSTKDAEKVPVLGDVPILGRVFRTTKNGDKKVSLIVIVTPYVIEDMETLKRIFERKLKERREYVKEMYGDEFKDSEVVQDYDDRVGTVESVKQIVARERLEKEARPQEELLVITPDGVEENKRTVPLEAAGQTLTAPPPDEEFGRLPTPLLEESPPPPETP